MEDQLETIFWEFRQTRMELALFVHDFQQQHKQLSQVYISCRFITIPHGRTIAMIQF